MPSGGEDPALEVSSEKVEEGERQTMIQALPRRSAVSVALAGLGTGVVVVTTSLGAAPQPGAVPAAGLGCGPSAGRHV